MEFKLFKRRKKQEGPSLHFLPDQRSVTIRGNDNLLSLALRAGIRINHSCDGNATCGTCRVKILSGNPGPRGPLETEWAQERGAKPDERLACQIKAQDGMIVEIPKTEFGD